MVSKEPLVGVLMRGLSVSQIVCGRTCLASVGNAHDYIIGSRKKKTFIAKDKRDGEVNTYILYVYSDFIKAAF